MKKQVEAFYENGSLHPSESLPLKEGQRVLVTISDFPVLNERIRLDVEYIQRSRKEVMAMARIPTLSNGDFLKCPVP